MRQKRGFTLIATLFIVLIVTLFAITVASFVSSGSFLAVANYHSLDTFYIANAGFQYYLKQLRLDDDWSTPPTQETKVFSGGTFAVTTTNESKNRINVRISAYLTPEGTTYRRILQSLITRVGGWAFEDEYAIYLGGGGGGTGEVTNIDNNVVITGDIYLDNDVDLGSGVIIDGDIESTGNITGGTGETQVATLDAVPTIDTTYYDNELATAATYPPGDESWTGNKTLSGVYYVNGDVFFGNNATINITGSAVIVITGTFLTNNSGTVGDNLTIIAGDVITIENSVTIGLNNVWFSSVGFNVGNIGEFGDITAGEGTAFITPGFIDIGNSIDFNGLLFCEGTLTLGTNTDFDGTIIAGFVDSIGENSNINIDPDLVDETIIEGLDSGSGSEEATEIETWDEVY